LLKPPTIISNHLVFKFFRPRSVTHIYLWGHVPIIRIFFRRNYLACGKIILPKPGCRLILWRHSFPCNLAPRTAARLALSGPLHMHVWIGSGFERAVTNYQQQFFVCFFMKMVHCFFFHENDSLFVFHENGPLFVFSWKWSIVF